MVAELTNDLGTWTLCQDVIIHRDGEEEFLLSNVFTRTHVGTDARGLEFIGALATPRRAVEIKAAASSQRAYAHFRDRTWFSNGQGLMADPSNLLRAPSVSVPCASEDALLDLLAKRYIVVGDQAHYREIFQPKTGMFDDRHLGNFHQTMVSPSRQLIAHFHALLLADG